MKSDFQKYQDFWEDEAQKNKDADQLYMTVGSVNPEQHDLVGTILTTGMKNNGLLPHHKILDIGCGNGRLAEKLTDYLSEEGEYFGFDISATLIEASKAKITAPNFHFSLSSGETFPFPDNHFDFIVLFSVFTHLHAPTISSFMKEIHRLLKNTGVCLATVIINNDIDQDAGDIQRMKHNYAYIESLVLEQGLVVESVQQKWPQESAEPAKVLFSDPEGSQSCLKIVKPDFPNIIRVAPKIFKSPPPATRLDLPFKPSSKPEDVENTTSTRSPLSEVPVLPGGRLRIRILSRTQIDRRRLEESPRHDSSGYPNLREWSDLCLQLIRREQFRDLPGYLNQRIPHGGF
ncbi:MAG: class I SAM-dependent methyltransferase [Deltaproteobacteria bacterium]|nr:class I SAM-dependent methyltransferase [Deltaproteobacteria bacterium]